MISKCSSSVIADVAVLRQLVQLALDHPQRDVAQQPDDVERVLRQRHRHRLDVEVVAEQDGDVVAPPRVHRQPPAPHFRLVDDVVVDERGGVDELHDGGVRDALVAGVAAQPRRHQQERPAGHACRRCSGCSGRSAESAGRGTPPGAGTPARRARGPVGRARRCAPGRGGASLSARCHSRGVNLNTDHPGSQRAARPRAARTVAQNSPSSAAATASGVVPRTLGHHLGHARHPRAARSACPDGAPARDTGCRSRPAGDRRARTWPPHARLPALGNVTMPASDT